MQEKRKLIYIMGVSHCGSTLLTTLLGRHSQIATMGELKATAMGDISDYLCGCGELLTRCPFWRKVAEELAARGEQLDLRDFKTRLRGEAWLTDKVIRPAIRSRCWESLRSLALKVYRAAAAELEAVLQRNRHFMDAVCTVEKKLVFLDGSKDPVRALHFARSPLFDTRIIHLVRDGRAVVASHKKRLNDMTRIIKDWRFKAEECERAKALLPVSAVLTLRYEDLCTDPVPALQAILTFANMADEGSSCLRETGHASRHILGHNSRLSSNREIKLREDWKALLSTEDMALFRRMEGLSNARYQYICQ